MGHYEQKQNYEALTILEQSQQFTQSQNMKTGNKSHTTSAVTASKGKSLISWLGRQPGNPTPGTFQNRHPKLWGRWRIMELHSRSHCNEREQSQSELQSAVQGNRQFAFILLLQVEARLGGSKVRVRLNQSRLTQCGKLGREAGRWVNAENSEQRSGCV